MWIQTDVSTSVLNTGNYANLGNNQMLAADIAIRLGPSAVEIKLGVVTALIGVPVFLAIIFRERRLLEGAPS